MNLRSIVPALGLVALTSAPALAADAMPAVSFEGWVDTILSYSTDDIEDDAGTTTEKDEEAGILRFSAAASLKANWKVTDALSARVNLWFAPADGDADGLNMREAYFAWAINDSVTWSMGKYIDHIGWIAAEPTGLYTINASLIGYTATYGNDVIGTSIAVAPKGSPISGSFHITNGYYTGVDATNNGPSDSRENSDLGFGLDLVYALPDEKGSVNLEFAYDIHSDQGTGDMGGDVFLVGANATIIPIKPLTLGVEVQYLMIGESDPAPALTGDDSVDRLQFLILANYAIEGASIPMSVTGMVQYVQIEPEGAPDPETRLGLTAALLTNPLTSSNFGLNFEIGYWDVADDVTGEISTIDPDATGFVVSVEGLVTF